MRKRTILVAALAFAMIVFLAACSGEKQTSSKDAGKDGGGEAVPGAATVEGVAGEGLTAEQEMPGVELNVCAAASLTDALGEIYDEYKKESDDLITFNFAASGTLQKQIIAGAPCDLFISASKGHMDGLADEGLIVAESRSDLLGNSLTLVAAAEKADAVKLDNLNGADVGSIAIGEPESVPAGQYAKQSLESMGVWDEVKDKLIFGKDVKQVQEYVDTGNADCGLVYRSDALMMTTGKIIGDVPENSHDPIVYPAALIAGSENQEAAAAFLKFVSGDFARTVFEKYGFKVL